MLPLAVYLAKSGAAVYGSDRSYDQGTSPDKFAALEATGIRLFPQDGSGISETTDFLVVSSAVEDHVPDVRAAKSNEIPIIKRGELLAQLFNDAKTSIAVAGTSGKSTVTGMIATILAEVGEDPTMINGGRLRNFIEESGLFFSSFRCGRSDLFVAEMDESDGSIAHYTPSYAVLNNIALDHKSMDELNVLFGDYVERATEAVIVNADDTHVHGLMGARSAKHIVRFSLEDRGADLFANGLSFKADGVDFMLHIKGEDTSYPVSLYVPGRHNVSNALAALSVVSQMGLDMGNCIQGLQAFRGVHRRLELVGSAHGVTVIDDFAHNPDKIAASLETLKSFEGRLHVIYQQHGYRALQMLRHELADAFVEGLGQDDKLIMPDVYYAGGTVAREVTAEDFVSDLKERGVDAVHIENRDGILDAVLSEAKSGDRIVVMGARDDTLHDFAKQILQGIENSHGCAVVNS